jgi:iron complex outermembrane receptor protein
MRNSLFLGAAAIALVAPALASAQSTGSIEVEDTAAEEEVVVTGTRANNGVEGIKVPDSTKARQVLTNEFLRRSTPGNTVLNALNIVPGVNFTQSDPFGSAGGNIRIRGFDGNRISLTFDGFPLNDSGNYAIFSNQQLDPELVEEINVNLGATDVDSPTASASGGTINYRTIVPREELSATVAAAAGDFNYTRVFGLIQTGNLTSFGTRAFVSASMARNDKFKGPGRIYKQQYNVGLYQPLGTNGDFFRVSGHYNENRNNFYRNPSLNDLRGTATVPGLVTGVPAVTDISAANPYTLGNDKFSNQQEDAIFGFERDAICVRPTPGPGAQNENNSCANYFNLFQNPSNTGNVRANSRFTLTDKLTLTADGGYQYVLANGGGTTTLAENNARTRGGTPTAAGVDYNSDGDFADTIRFYTPNNTNTNRYTFTSSLIYDLTDQHRVRIAYTYDRAKHRQTGEWGYLDAIGNPESPFSGRNARPVLTADGFQIQQRDRTSVALLNQISGQYVGKFFDNRLTIDLGLRAPFFERELETFCPVQARDGFAYCTSEAILPVGSAIPGTAGSPAIPATPTTPAVPAVPATAANTTPVFVNQGVNLALIPARARPVYAPFAANYKYDKLLPNVGFVYRFAGALDGASIFGSYAKGISNPRTDNLYRAPVVTVEPESTDSFDLGLRYTTSRVQAQATGWYITYKNRIVTSFDQDQGISVDRNVGSVESYGIDASISFRPIDAVALTAFGSYTFAELQDDLFLGNNAAGTAVFAPTAGKKVVETPEFQFGGRAQVELGPVEIGATAKWVDDRFVTDVNDVVSPSYTLVDLDARLSLEQFGLPRTFFQLNVQNLFDEFYFGNLSTQLAAGTIGGFAGANPNFSVGFPRTFTAGLNIEF